MKPEKIQQRFNHVKTKEFTKIARKILPQFPQLATERMLIFLAPIGDILCGLAFGSSSDAKIFYVHKFLLPLYVPTEAVHVTFGERIRINGNEGWRSDDPNLIENLTDTIRREIPFFTNTSTITGALDFFKADIENGRPRVNSHELEALAYTFVKNGNYSSALESLADLKQRLQGDTIPWVVAQFNRAQLIEGKLLQNPEAALQQLEIWKAETFRKIGLEKYMGPRK